MKKFLIICLILFGTILPSFAANWVQYAEKEYIDTDSITPLTNDYGQIVPYSYVYWVKYLNNNSDYWKSLEKRAHTKGWYIIEQKVINLNKKLKTEIFIAVFDVNQNCIFRDKYEDYLSNLNPIIPDSLADLEYEVINKYIKQRR